jgi:hypothetical protein
MNDQLMEAAAFHGSAENAKLYTPYQRLKFALQALDRYQAEAEQLIREKAELEDKLAAVWREGYWQAVANGTDHWGVVNPYARKAEGS